MKIVPAQGPTPASHDTQSPAQQDARARAIAKLTGASTAPTANVEGQSAPIPVNANQISPEDVSAVKQIAQASEPAAVTETTEVPAPATAEPKSEDPSLTDKYNLLARRERAMRVKAQQQEQAIREREKAIAAKQAEIQAKEEEFKQGYIPKSQLKQAALDAILAGELPYDEVTEQVLGQQRTDPRVMNYIQKLEAKIAKLEQGTEEIKNTYTNSQDQAYKAAVNQIRTDVTTLVKSDSNFELVKATQSVGDVVELIEKTFKEEGVLLSVEEATQQVEDYLVEEAMRLAKSSKIQKRMQPAPATQAAPVKTEQQPIQQPQMKTLTNAAASTRKLSAKERAILAFKGEKA